MSNSSSAAKYNASTAKEFPRQERGNGRRSSEGYRHEDKAHGERQLPDANGRARFVAWWRSASRFPQSLSTYTPEAQREKAIQREESVFQRNRIGELVRREQRHKNDEVLYPLMRSQRLDQRSHP